MTSSQVSVYVYIVIEYTKLTWYEGMRLSEARELDEEKLLARVTSLAAQHEAVTIVALRRLQGGASGITYVAEIEGGLRRQSVVVKVAPAGLAPVKNRDVLRQADVLRALSGSPVPVPKVLFTWAGDGEVPPFFVTEFVEGDVYEPIFDGPGRLSGKAIHARALHAARLLAQLHCLDPWNIGIHPGPEVTPAEEVQRWARAFESVPSDLRFEGPALGRALAAHPPYPVAPVLVHGDFRLGNMIARGDAVRAVLDWEIWALSDPRIDLAWFVTQADAGSHPLACWQPPSMPTPATLVEAYEEVRGVSIGPLGWFTALIRFKTAATSALIIKHARTEPTPDPIRTRWGPGIEPLTHEGLRILEEAL
jgi:aminoglycoside phosphotransferase (APT) family kinase protein